jgi:hypothetical protein
MKLGILGTGTVGQTLANGFLAQGHAVKLGAREATNEKASAWAAGKERASHGTFAEAAAFGEVVILATLGSVTEDVIRSAGIDHFTGKVVIDTTNPLDFSKGAPALFVGHTDSFGERVQRLLPAAKVVKAYNTVGSIHMIKPSFPGGRPDMFIAGNDAEAKKLVTEINTSFEWGTVDLGGIEASRYLEPMCLAWVIYGIRSGSWNHAFALLRK